MIPSVNEVYDYDEGIRKHSKRIYSEIIDVIQSVVPTGDALDTDEKNPEEIKGYHHKQMSAWKT